MTCHGWVAFLCRLLECLPRVCGFWKAKGCTTLSSLLGLCLGILVIFDSPSRAVILYVFFSDLEYVEWGYLWCWFVYIFLCQCALCYLCSVIKKQIVMTQAVQQINIQGFFNKVFAKDLDFKRYAENELGYESLTTFWQDFTIAEHFGLKEIQDTFKRATKEWISNGEYFTELVLVLRTKIGWFRHQNKEELVKLYERLFHEADAIALSSMNAEDLAYYQCTLGVYNVGVTVHDDMDFVRFAKENLGYDCITTYWSDFSKAQHEGGQQAIRELFNKVFEDCKKDYKRLTELVLITNHKLNYHYGNKDMELAKLYDELWREADAYGCNHLEGEEADYFYRTLD